MNIYIRGPRSYHNEREQECITHLATLGAVTNTLMLASVLENPGDIALDFLESVWVLTAGSDGWHYLEARDAVERLLAATSLEEVRDYVLAEIAIACALHQQ